MHHKPESTWAAFSPAQSLLPQPACYCHQGIRELSGGLSKSTFKHSLNGSQPTPSLLILPALWEELSTLDT